MERLYQQAKKVGGRILLPEALLDERVMQACKQLIKEELCEVLLIGEREQFSHEIRTNPLVKIINPKAYYRIEEMRKLFVQKRKKSRVTKKQAEEILQDLNYFSTMLLEMGEADGMVLGAYYTTADALRPPLQIIKAKDGKRVVGSMLLDRADFDRPLLFLDVSLNENPTAEELAEFGLSGAHFYKEVLSRIPKVAFLSYSTYGSANGELVEKARRASQLIKDKIPFADGEMQFDAAIVPEVAKIKCPSSPIKGGANVLVFPDLNCGNIAYKIAERIGGCEAIGPIMLNFRLPVNDLSRGCSVEDIVNTAIITKLQIEEK